VPTLSACCTFRVLQRAHGTCGAVNAEVVANRGFGPKDRRRHPAHDSTRGTATVPCPRPIGGKGPSAFANWRTRAWIRSSSRHSPMYFCPASLRIPYESSGRSGGPR
jgi:hypothetical protein